MVVVRFVIFIIVIGGLLCLSFVIIIFIMCFIVGVFFEMYFCLYFVFVVLSLCFFVCGLWCWLVVMVVFSCGLGGGVMMRNSVGVVIIWGYYCCRVCFGGCDGRV